MNLEPLDVDGLVKRLSRLAVDVQEPLALPPLDQVRSGDVLRAAWDSCVVLVLVSAVTNSAVSGHAAEVGQARDRGRVCWLDSAATPMNVRLTVDPREREFPAVVFDALVTRLKDGWTEALVDADAIDVEAEDGLLERAEHLENALRPAHDLRTTIDVGEMTVADLESAGIRTQRALQLVRGGQPTDAEVAKLVDAPIASAAGPRPAAARAMDEALAGAEFRVRVRALAERLGESDTDAWWTAHQGALALAARQAQAAPEEVARQRVRAYLSSHGV